jgi:8-oxo-dGTP diphosphatase
LAEHEKNTRCRRHTDRYRRAAAHHGPLAGKHDAGVLGVSRRQACRELAEELGIEFTACEHFCSLEHDYPELRVAIDFFLVRQWRGTPSGIEGQALQWLRPSDMSRELLLPADAPVLELLKEL